jgi:hypothetical protein
MSKVDDVAALEKAISKKYGDVAIKNPKSGWDEDKEQEYQEQTKILQKRQKKAEDEQDKVEVDGFFLSKKLLTREKENIDDLYMRRYKCCYNCYMIKEDKGEL